MLQRLLRVNMKFKIINGINTMLFFTASMMLASCNEQGNTVVSVKTANKMKLLLGDTVSQIDGEIRGVFQDKKNNLWFASNGNGIFKYDGNSIVNFTEKHGLSSDYVWMVQEGKDGNIWFKTNVRPKDVDAICCFNGYEFRTIEPDTNLTNYNFKKGELLFDYYYDGKMLSKIKLPHTSPIKNDLNKKHHYDVYSTCIDKIGNIWFGTATAGICKYDGKNYTWFENLELGAAIRDIYEDKNGTIWVGNNGDGLFRYDGKDFINFSKQKNLHNPDFEKYPTGKPGLLSRVWKITEDSLGNLWIATIDNGVWMVNEKSVINYTTKDGLSIDAIWTIYRDRNGNLWFGTEGGGVYTFNGKTFERFAI